MRPAADVELVQIANASLADAAHRSGHWLACRPGCWQCCVGVFPISSLDAERLKDGMHSLDPTRQQAVRQRVAASVQELGTSFPGDFVTGIINEQAEGFDDFGNGVTCPALDPATGTCDLYEFRPMTCRTFGPPVPNEGGLGVCELCFVGAPEADIAKAEMDVSFLDIEEGLSAELGPGETFVALALRGR